MLHKIPLHKILFIDVETVPEFKNWEDLSEKGKELWDKKTAILRKEETARHWYTQRAGIYAEFAKIVCISCGIIVHGELKIKSFFGHSESQILQNFCDLLRDQYFDNQLLLCAHNGKEFDFPFLARRMTINEIELPNLLQLHGKKPWEIQHLDTLELWKFGDYKHYSSLDLLAYVFGIETPKADMDGSQVAQVYYVEKNLEKIKNYCEKDVETLIKVYRKLARV